MCVKNGNKINLYTILIYELTGIFQILKSLRDQKRGLILLLSFIFGHSRVICVVILMCCNLKISIETVENLLCADLLSTTVQNLYTPITI